MTFFVISQKCQTHKFCITRQTHRKKRNLELLEKFKLPIKRGFKLTEKWKNKKDSCPPANTPLWTQHDVYGMEYFHISTGQLGLAAWLYYTLPAPAHLLISWTLESGKSCWFHSNNWKYQCYQHSFCTKSKTQQLLGGKFMLSQLKSGHT